MKVGIKLVKVKKFGIGWSIPHRVVADNSEGGFVRLPPPSSNRVKGNHVSGAGPIQMLFYLKIIQTHCPT